MSLEMLRALTAKLPALGNFNYDKQDNTCLIEYAVERGAAFCAHVYKNDGVAVGRCFFSAGTLFPRHSHEVKEWFLVVKGEMTVTLEDGTSTRVSQAQCYEVPPNTPHRIEAHTDICFMAVTIPADKDFP